MKHLSVAYSKARNGAPWTVALFFLGLIGCEGNGTSANCVVETAYLCVDEGCFCADDTQRQNPLTELEAEEVCGACRPSAEGAFDPDAFTIPAYDRFGGIDDFSGDDNWGSGPR